MPTLTSTFAIDDLIWVVDPTGPVLLSGKVAIIGFIRYEELNGNVVDVVNYTILLDDNKGTLTTTNAHMRTLQSDGVTLLTTLIDNIYC